MKITKKQFEQLQDIVYDIQRAYDYLQEPKIVGIAYSVIEGRQNGGDYVLINPDASEVLKQPKYIGLHSKDIGSNIAGLSMGLGKLKNFIDVNLQ